MSSFGWASERKEEKGESGHAEALAMTSASRLAESLNPGLSRRATVSYDRHLAENSRQRYAGSAGIFPLTEPQKSAYNLATLLCIIKNTRANILTTKRWQLQSRTVKAIYLLTGSFFLLIVSVIVCFLVALMISPAGQEVKWP
jgi:hypothetical protein